MNDEPPLSEPPPDLVSPRRERAKFADRILDRLPPHSPEAEQGVLGCILLSPNDCICECLSEIKPGREAFYDLRHQELYKQCCEIYEDGVVVDMITLKQRLDGLGIMDRVGGFKYLLELPDTVPSAANLPFYIGIVLEKFMLRRLLQVCGELSSRVFEFTSGGVTELLETAERDILKIRILPGNSKGATMRELIPPAMATIEAYHSRQGVLLGMPTGIGDLDKLTGGLQNCELTIIAARPSMGKSSLAMQIAEHLAIQHSFSVGFFSLEMSKESLALRALCGQAKVNFRNIADGYMAERDFPRLTSAAGRLMKSRICIEDVSGMSILQFKAKARRMKQQHGVSAIFVDYMQLMTASTGRGARIENRAQEVGEIANGLKGVAKELNLPVIAMAQLGRGVERDGRKPRLSDLRESGDIEAAGDLILLMHRPDKGEDDEGEKDAYPTDIIVAKSRNGPTGVVHTIFLSAFTRFENASKVCADDLPDEPPQTNLPYRDV